VYTRLSINNTTIKDVKTQVLSSYDMLYTTEHPARVYMGVAMDARAIEPLPFETNTPYTAADWRVNEGIEVVSATGRFYTIVVTAMKADSAEGIISIVNKKWRLRKDEQCAVTLRAEDGMIVVHSRT
jgi:hypothetical protein